ncbi:MAG: rhodanese-like domain-containing protein [Bergeyella sp.]|nr:rhodanese-like domain-containing protein [Bergeyella sp.]
MGIDTILKSGKYKLIDVREPIELDMDGSIGEAENIPLGSIEERKEELLSYDVPLIIFCRSGNRSGKALEYLTKAGLKEGYNGGGWQALKEQIQNINAD